MKKVLLCLILSIFTSNLNAQNSQDYTIDLARKFSKDLFESNGVPFMEPVVRVINSTSNSRFFTQAYVPQKVKKPYFRVGIHGMSGLVNDDLKSFSPVMPSSEYRFEDVGRYIEMEGLNIKRLDTAGLIHYLFMNMMYDGTKGANAGLIKVPQRASTALGTGDTKFELPHESLETLFKNHPLYNFPLIPQGIKDSVSAAIANFPEVFTLYGGNNLNMVFAAIPQFEIGSLYGTELLIRLIPPINLGETIGDFAFWGVGVKHSISQYFFDEYDQTGELIPVYQRPFDMAVQVVYQGTYLENKIGVTQADLKANASLFSINFHASKSFENLFDVYTGISYETINITSKYKYLLPVEIQRELGLLDKDQEYPTPGFPGDTNPQTTELTIDASNLRWTIGIIKPIGNFDIFLDYSVSRFDILSGGIQYRF
ncbi:MAG: hypothetical protein KIT33_08965 [Candidatus Kapabacteria bacterium]|nr:hypothetical protein [Ignavibacteriota bacterium]MCW5885087.1 hypothetical protein [Candidatus Kapabacteria bacterium]